MSFAIRVDNISKCFRIPHAKENNDYRMLREDLMRLVLKPWKHREGKGRRAYEEFWAVSDVNFEIQPGEMVGLIGRNGAGKSTLLKMLSRVMRPTKGTARIRGRVGSLLEVGTGFHTELTGRENILLSGSILGMTRKEIVRKFDEIVDFAGVEKFIDTPVKRYSTGMVVRLGFAVAANLDPEILIVDEVLAVGDFGFMQKSSAKMGEITAEGRTVLMVTHNLPVIEALTTRCLVMKNGRLDNDGPTADVVGEYRGQWLEQGTDKELPGKFTREVSSPKVHIENIRLQDDAGKELVAAVSEQPLNVVFDVVAESDFRELVVNACICRDKVVVVGGSSHHMLRGFTIAAGQRKTLRIRYESLLLNSGRYTVAFYVLPSQYSPMRSCMSDFHTKGMVVEGARDQAEGHAHGYVTLSQSWNVEGVIPAGESVGA